MKLSSIAPAQFGRTGLVDLGDKSASNRLSPAQDGESGFAQVLDARSRSTQREQSERRGAKPASENSDKADKSDETDSKRTVCAAAFFVAQQYPDKLKPFPGPFAALVDTDERGHTSDKSAGSEATPIATRVAGVRDEAAQKQTEAVAKDARAGLIPSGQILASPISAMEAPVAPNNNPQITTNTGTAPSEGTAEQQAAEPVSDKASAPGLLAGNEAAIAFAIRLNPAIENGDRDVSQATPAAQAGEAPPITQRRQPIEAVSRMAEIVSTSPQSRRDAEAHDPAIAAGLPADSMRDTKEETLLAEHPASSAPASDFDPKTDGSQQEVVRSLRMQLNGENNQRVDMRLLDRGGELRVVVRSADQNLSQALQDHMPELTARLGQQHFRADVWAPRTTASSNDLADSGKSLNGNGANAGEDGSKRRQNGHQAQEPDWLDELEDYPRRTQTSRTIQI